MPDVTLALRRNGGAAVAGGITAAVGDTIQPTALDKSGWRGTPRWELWIYEPGAEGYYAGYTADAAPDATLPTLYKLGIADPPSFVLPAAGLYELRVVYGGGAQVSQAIIKVPYANGNFPIGPDETLEYGGQKLGAYKALNDNAAAGSGGGATPAPATFSELLSFDLPKSMTVPNAFGETLIGVDASGTHVAGVEHQIDVPPSSATSLRFAKSLSVGGDVGVDSDGVVQGFSTSARYRIWVGCVDPATGEFYATVRILTPDLVAPVISTAAISNTNPDGLVVTYDKPCYQPTLTGCSINVTSGGAATITAKEAGNRSKVHTLTLSRNFIVGDAANLVIGSSRDIQSNSGVKLAAVTFPINVSLLPTSLAGWGFTEEWRTDAGRTGDPVSNLAEQIVGGGTLDVAQSTSGSRPDWQAGPPEVLALDGTDDFIYSGASSTLPQIDGAWLAMVHIDNTGGPSSARIPLCLGGGASAGFIAITVNNDGTMHLTRNADDGNSTNVCDKTGITAGKMTIIASHNGSGTYKLWTNVDATVTTSSSQAALIAAHPITKASPAVCFGGFLNSNGVAQFYQGKWYHAGFVKGSTQPATTDWGNIHTLVNGMH